jgi:streptogramin lyase
VGVDGANPLEDRLAGPRPQLALQPPVVHKIDPRSNQDVTSIPSKSVIWVVLTTGEGAVWAAGRGGDLVRIDPTTTEAQPVANLAVPAGAITLVQGSLWIASVDGEIVRVDAATGDVVATVPGGGSPGGLQGLGSPAATLGITSGNGIIWVTDKIDGTISRVVAISNSGLEPIKVGQTPTGVAFGYGSVWVTVDATA